MNAQRLLKLRVRIVVERDENEFHAYCPELKGLHVDAPTENKAVECAVEAVQLYVASLLKHGDPIPVGVLDDGEDFSLRHFMRKKVHSWFCQTHESSHIRDVLIAS